MSCLADDFKGDRTSKDAANGYFAPPLPWRQKGLPHLEHRGMEDWVLTCEQACLNTATMFLEVGAFDQTGYCKSYNEIGSVNLKLRGFPSTGDYPANGVVLASVPADGEYGIIRSYAAGFTGQYVLYDWLETDTSGRKTASEPFVLTTKPPNWDWSYSTSHVDADSLLAPEAVSAPQDTTATTYSAFLCALYESFAADIVVYSSAESLATPVKDQIVADLPGKRIRMVIGADNSAQKCLNSLSSVYHSNKYVNTYCNPTTPYPVDPGPEVYVVGDLGVVNCASFTDDSGRCGSNNCRSDYLLYDVDGNLRPDGPISRIPAKTVAEATRAASSASEFTQVTNVAVGHVILLEGAKAADTTYVAGHFLDQVQEQYVRLGMSVHPRLRDIDFQYGESPTRQQAFIDAVNDGVQEVFGLGGYSSLSNLPGGFVTLAPWPQPCSPDFTQFSRTQRIVSWMPDCHIHSLWFPTCYDHCSDHCIAYRGPIAGLMFNDPNLTTVAASVSHMSAAWEHQHWTMGALLSQERYRASIGEAPVSVARVVFDAVTRCFDELPWMTGYALSVSSWGSYVQLPLVDVTGVWEERGLEEEARLNLSPEGPVAMHSMRVDLRLPDRVARAELDIFDLQGRHIRTLAVVESPGFQQVKWDLRDGQGARIASGVYYLRLMAQVDARQYSRASKIIVLR